MKKFIALTLLALIYVGSAQAQLLYQISGNGLKRDSYIVGTYHLAPASFVDSIVGAREALASVEAVCGELDMESMASAENSQRLQAEMLIPGGMHISDLLNEEQMVLLNSYMRDLLGMDFSSRLIDKTMGNLRPVAISMQLQVAAFMKLTPGFNPLALIDDYFQKQARSEGKRVMGLESVDDQIVALFGSNDLNAEVAELMAMVEDPEKTHLAMQTLADAYFSQDFDRIRDIVLADLITGETTPEKWERICVRRNYNWIERMPSIMSEQPTLFVVGVAHLVGEDGVLALLQDAGYSIIPVEFNYNEDSFDIPDIMFIEE